VLHAFESAFYGAARVALRFPYRGPHGVHITRYEMFRTLRAEGKKLSLPREPRVASISHSIPLCDALGFSEREELDYPEYDILDLAVADHSFDAVACDQVIEHVEGAPQRAVDEMFRILKPGGYLFLATCFVNPYHGAPKDFWRFSPGALELLCKGRGKVITSGGWGNRWVWLVERAGLRYHPVPETKWSLLRRLATINDPEWAVHTWVVARKS
jgi:SAM-dependent methyltransferase